MPPRVDALLPLALSSALLACGGAAPTQRTTGAEQGDEPAGQVTAETPEPTAEARGPATPRALLEAIRDRVASGDIDAVAEHVLDYRDPAGGDTRALVMEGIRSGDDRGDWAFSLPALEALIRRADDFGPPSETLASMIMRSSGDADERLTDPGRYLVFEETESQAHVMLLEHEGRLWLLFWENLTSLR